MEDGGWRIDEAYKFGVEEVKIFAPTLKGEFSLGWCLCLKLRIAGYRVKIFAPTLKGEFSSVGVYV